MIIQYSALLAPRLSYKNENTKQHVGQYKYKKEIFYQSSIIDLKLKAFITRTFALLLLKNN